MGKYVVCALLVVIGVLLPPVGLIMLGAFGLWAWLKYGLSKKVMEKAKPYVDYVKTHEIKFVEKSTCTVCGKMIPHGQCICDPCNDASGKPTDAQVAESYQQAIDAAEEKEAKK